MFVQSALYRHIALSLVRGFTSLLPASGPHPIVVNSVPKAGTHLVTRLLDVMRGPINTRRLFNEEGRIGTRAERLVRAPDAELAGRRFAASLQSLKGGHFASAHMMASPGAADAVARCDARVVFVERDPRDVAVSGFFYSSQLRRHGAFDFMGDDSISKHDRLMAQITGLGPDGTPVTASIGDRWAAMSPWRTMPATLSVRFEDLIGEHGGGSESRRKETISAIAAHVGFPLTAQQLERVSTRLATAGSATKRKGMIGDWRNHLTDAHLSAMEASLRAAGLDPACEMPNA